jgi:predicted amidohydrolase
MAQTFTAAAVQMVSGSDVKTNLATAGRLIGQAAQAGARLVALPENFALLGRREQDKLAVAEPDGAGPIQDFLADTACRHGIHLIGGTIPLRGPDPQRVRAACLLHGPDGRRLARYDKIHLFDVEVGEGGERYRESASIEPGDAVVTVDTELGCIGLAVCYDLRFPELFRTLLAQGAQILVLPSAFTETTGAAHWHLLCRARAVENLCYLLAPGQGGQHDNGRRTYGHSLIVGPWGEVLAEHVEIGEGAACADIDLAALHRLRARFPAVQHRNL